MDYYVGLDVSLRSVVVFVIDASGKHVFERVVACEIEDIVACLRDVPHGLCRIGFESGAMSQHLYFGLQGAGFRGTLRRDWLRQRRVGADQPG